MTEGNTNPSASGIKSVDTFESNAAIQQPEPAEASAEQPAVEAPAPMRVLAGLQASRLVWYVLLDLTVRPFLIVCAGDGSGKVTGVLFFKGKEDERNLPVPLMPDDSGHKPALSVLVSAEYSEDGLAGTWMWPTKQAVFAANVDPDAIRLVVDAMIDPIIDRVVSTFRQFVDDRLRVQDEAVKAQLDANGELLKDAVGGIRGAVSGLVPDAGQGFSRGAEGKGPAPGTTATEGTAAAPGDGESSGKSESASTGS